MADIIDYINFQTLLQTTVTPRQSFGIQLFLVDDDQIPVDVRYRYVTPAGYTDDLEFGTVPRDYATVFFSQDLKADKLMLGRWVGSASHPYFICGPGYEKNPTVWASYGSTGSFKVVDNSTPTPLEDEVIGVVLGGVTTLQQAADQLTAAIQAIVTPNITGLDTSEFKIDSLGRLILEMPTTGSTAKTVYITTASSGTDISEPLLDASNGTVVAGYDVEEPVDAVDAISDLDDTWYNLHERGATADQQMDLADYVEGREKLVDLFITDTDAYNPADTDNVPYKIFNGGYKRVLCVFPQCPEYTDTYPDAAAAGRFLPAEEGSTQFEGQRLYGLSSEFSGTPLTITQRTVLEDRNCSYIVNVSGTLFLFNGLTGAGIEKRIMLGRDWFNARNREDIFTYQIQQALVSFDNQSLSAIEGIIWSNIREGIARRILVDTPNRPATVTFPDADDITQAERATHTLTVFDAFRVFLNIAIHRYQIVGTWTI